MKKLLFAGVMALAALSSCQKNNAETDVTPNFTPSSNQRVAPGVDDAANPDNPYDEIGVIHNQMLSATQAVSWGGKDRSFARLYAATVDYTKRNLPGTPIPDQVSLEATTKEIIADAPGLTKTIANAKLSSEGKSYMTRLVATLGETNDSTDTWDAYKKRVIALESDVLKNARLPKEDAKYILEAASVGRHSVLFWTNQYYDGNPAGSNANEARFLKGNIAARGLWGWIKANWKQLVTVAVADVGGAAGGVLGAAVASGGSAAGQTWN